MAAATKDVWLRSDRGFSVSLWVDQFGLGHNLAQGIGSKQFTFSASGGPNNLPFVTGDAVDDFMRGTWTANQPLMLFAVAKVNTQTVANATMWDGSVGNSHRVWQSGAAPSSVNDLSTDGGAILTDTVAPTTWRLYRCRCNGASSRFQIDDRAAVNGDAGLGNAGGLILNIFGDQASAPGNVSFVEVIRYASIPSAADEQRIRDYIKLRTGV